jgi:hypothetical protein
MAVPKKRTSKSKKKKRKNAWKKKAEIWRNIGIPEVEFDPLLLFEPPPRLKGGLRTKNKNRIKIQLIKGQGFKDQLELVSSEPVQIETIPPDMPQSPSKREVVTIDIDPSETLPSISSENAPSDQSQSEKPL